MGTYVDKIYICLKICPLAPLVHIDYISVETRHKEDPNMCDTKQRTQLLLIYSMNAWMDISAVTGLGAFPILSTNVASRIEAIYRRDSQQKVGELRVASADGS
jgi:hypothetical protein